MFEVKLVNTKTNQQWGATLPTKIDCYNWLNEQKKKPGREDAVEQIIDISKEKELKDKYEKYLKELPSKEELINYLISDNLEELEAKIDDVRKRYPEFWSYPKDKIGFAWDRFRKNRDKKLKETDYTQLADVSLSSEEKKTYREYRKYLRDLPKMHNNTSIWDAEVKSYEEWKNGVHTR